MQELLPVSLPTYRGDKEVGVAHEVMSPENQPQFSQVTMG